MVSGVGVRTYLGCPQCNPSRYVQDTSLSPLQKSRPKPVRAVTTAVQSLARLKLKDEDTGKAGGCHRGSYVAPTSYSAPNCVQHSDRRRLLNCSGAPPLLLLGPVKLKNLAFISAILSMCGVSAVVALESLKLQALNKDTYSSALEIQLNESLDEIEYRGPDARGQWISQDNRIALGYVRLAINDLTPAGEQPFQDEIRGVHAVVNGELYESEKVRAELGGLYSFKGNSDCEIIIALYLHYGIHFLSKLRGEFALCLYDARRQLFIAARDRYGVKPLFWTVHNKRLLIVSEAKALLPFGWKPEWDVRSLIEDGWLHDERTIFKGVNKIQPGHYLICSSFSHMAHREYWDLEFPDKCLAEARSEEEMILGLRERLLQAIKVRLQADVPVGIYLSGGIDSAIIAGMVAHLINQEKAITSNSVTQSTTCFGIGFEGGDEFDETPIARRTANSIGLPFVTKRMTEESLASKFEDATFHAEHHNPDLNYIAKFALSELAQEHGYKTVLSGEGSDEHFGGYWHFLPDFLREPDRTWPEQPMTDCEREALTLAKERDSEPGYTGSEPSLTLSRSHIARRMLNNTSIASNLWAVTMAHFAPWTRVFGDLEPQETRARSPNGRVLSAMNSAWHPLHTSQYIWTKSILPNLILTCMGDRMEMAHSIEGRPPFLDHVLTEYVNQLPPSMKIRVKSDTKEVVEKWILREAGKPFITEEIYKRKKHPFTAPIIYPSHGPLHALLTRLLNPSTISQLGFLDVSKTNRLLDLAFGPARNQSALRYAFTVAQWVVLAQRFGIATARPPFETRQRHGWDERPRARL